MSKAALIAAALALSGCAVEVAGHFPFPPYPLPAPPNPYAYYHRPPSPGLYAPWRCDSAGRCW